MSDRRRIRIIISAVGATDNFETNEKLDEAHTEVVQISVEDSVSLYRVACACRKLVQKVEDKL